MSSLSEAHSGAGGAPEATSTPDETDARLMNLARAGDRAAFGQIVLRYQDRLYTAVLRMVGDRDDARELTQEAFTRALMSLDSFRAEAGPYTWLFRIAMNLAISRLRKSARRRVVSLDTGGNGSGNAPVDQAAGLVNRLTGRCEELPHEAVAQRELQQQVLAALGRLDSEYRAILVMRDIEGFDYQQMADVLGLPLGTLKSRLFRARLALRDELKAYLHKG